MRRPLARARTPPHLPFPIFALFNFLFLCFSLLFLFLIQYLAKPGARPYCSAEPRGVELPPFESWAPAALKEKHAPKLPEAFWKEHAPTPHCVIRSVDTPIKWP